MAFVGQKPTALLLHNKCVVVIGDSIQRSVYKDIVLLLQRETFLSPSQLCSKGEVTFESDALVEGGCLANMNNGTDYREVRQFRSRHHLVRFYFVTRVFSRYMRSVLDDLRRGPTPDLVVVNSCVWDISRYKTVWAEDYKKDLHLFFGGLKEVLPQETLVVWNLSMPLGHKILGGFLTPELSHKAAQLRSDVVEANFCSSQVACSYGADVLDLHYSFRLSLQQRVRDGVHWNAIAHRRMTSLLLRHAADSWGVRLPAPAPPPPSRHGPPSAVAAAKASGVLHMMGFNPGTKAPKHRIRDTQPREWLAYSQNHRPTAAPTVFQSDRSSAHLHHLPAHPRLVMRNRHARKAYAPYDQQRPSHSPSRKHIYI
ncbi:hypothetical protein NHX12_014352 [Muraenolepis orangiensis]|uniref:Family with sequence similarity 113 n=1 Tax=Muraenolepis orangiensis TaxID=630683 RepID=A0A9Q0DDL1_9TELE|nr:hypothetical protein NHX12_014352 [Muraenolepis orangiensis]